MSVESGQTVMKMYSLDIMDRLDSILGVESGVVLRPEHCPQNSKYIIVWNEKPKSNSSKVDVNADSNYRCSLATTILVVLHSHSPVVSVKWLSKIDHYEWYYQILIVDLLRSFGARVDVPAKQDYLLLLW